MPDNSSFWVPWDEWHQAEHVTAPTCNDDGDRTLQCMLFVEINSESMHDVNFNIYTNRKG